MVPCGDHTDSWFCHDLYRAGVHHAFTYPDDMQYLVYHQGAFIHESRNQLVKSALEAGCDYLIFLDTDMRFPQNLYSQLIDHNVPVVAANCSKRRRPISATARRENPDDPSQLDAVWPDREVTGLERIAVVGTAVMGIQADVFMQLEYPWFNTPWLEEEQRFVGEDVFFCAQLKREGVPLYIDHDLSWGVGHCGTYVYEMKDVLAEHEMAQQGLWNHIKPEQLIAAAV